MEGDLSEYRIMIRGTDILAPEKARLIQRVDRIQEGIKKGRLPHFFNWFEHDDAIRALLKDEHLSDASRKALDAELKAIEREQSGNQ